MVGQTLGAYHVLGKLGEGGMGEVYRARDTRLGRDVALKVLPDAFARDSDRLARFQREAQLLASLNHPNIASIYGLEESGHTKALVMELVEGRTLADRIAQRSIPIDEALPIATQIAEALEAAHEQGIIHRDLKPANIKLRPDGTVKVLDFGLAKLNAPTANGQTGPNISTMSPTFTAPAVTQTGAILGTAAYMSPEQARGQRADERTDVWALGCVLFEMISGSPAFPGAHVSDVLAAVIRGEPSWRSLPPHTPPRLRELLDRCLRNDAGRRKQSMADLRVELEDLIRAPSDLDTYAGPRPRRMPMSATLVGVGMAVGVVIGLTLMALRSDSAPPTVVSRFPIPLSPEVTNTEAFNNYPSSMLAIAPDGSRLAVVGGPSHALHVREFGELSFRRLPGTEGARNPFFSPDGEQIAFFTKGTRELKIVSLAAGSRPRTLVDTIALSDWAFGSWGDNDTIVFAVPDSGLFSVSADDPVVRTLTTPAGIRHNYPQFLPGSTAVVFSTQEDETTTIQALALTDPDAMPVTLFANASHPQYLASGHLLFVREQSLWAAPFDPVTFTAGVPVSVPIDVAFDNHLAHDGTPQLAVSESGTLVYASGVAERAGRLVWVDRSGQVVEDLGPAPGGLPALQLSPEGTRLALEYRDGPDVIVSSFDVIRRVNESVLLRKRQIFRGAPLWHTPDASRVIVSRPGIVQSTMLMLAAGNDAEPVELFTADGSWLFPLSISADGRRLLYNVSTPDGSQDVGVYEFGEDLEGGTHRLLLDGPEHETQPSWAPDGRAFAYVVGDAEVWVRPYPTGQAIRVSPTGGFGPLWSRDGAELFYQRDGGRELWVVPIIITPALRVGEARMLFAGSYARSGDAGFSYDVSIDGRRFLMVATDPQEWMADELVVVLNWFEELARRVRGR